MKEKILDNLTLKLLAIIFAITAWMIIVNSYDPYTSVTYSGIVVTLENEDALSDKGYTYSVLDGSRISVTLSGPNSKITTLSAANVEATADLATLQDDSDYVDIKVRVVKNGAAVDDVTATPNQTSLRLNVENRSTDTFDVSLMTVGDAGANYAVLNGAITPDTVTVSGSTSDVESIAFVRAVYDISGVTSDIDAMVPIVLYDSSGNTIDTSNFSLSADEVHYTADVSQSKEIPISVSTSGKPAAGYTVASVTPDVSTITISGDADKIGSIDSLVIPSSALSVEGLSDSTTFRLWISDYLPDGVSVTSDDMVSVRVEIQAEKTGTISLSPSDITVKNLADGLSASIESDTLSVDVEGSASAISSLKASDLNASASANGLTEGSDQYVFLNFSPPTGVTVTGQYRVNMHVVKAEDGSADTSQTTSATSSSAAQETTEASGTTASEQS